MRRGVLLGAAAGLAVLVAGAIGWRLGPKRRLRGAGVAQAACPSGRLAGPVARVLNVANKGVMTDTLDAIGDPGARMIDIGFGGGGLIHQAMARWPDLRVAGLEPSPHMVARAERSLAHEIRAGRVDIRSGAIEDIPWADDSFGSLVTLNTPYFWRDRARALAEIGRVVQPGGIVAIGLPDEPLQRRFGFEESGYALVPPASLADALVESGFVGVETRELGSPRRPWVLILARVPESGDHPSPR